MTNAYRINQLLCVQKNHMIKIVRTKFKILPLFIQGYMP